MHRRSCSAGLAVVLAIGCADDLTGTTETAGPDTSSAGGVDLPTGTPTTTTPTTSGSTTESETTDGPPGGPSASTSGDDDTKCGNGVLEADEECDEAGLNSDEGACTHHCKKAVCGDGNVRDGHEECDEGPQNAVGYGNCLPGECRWDGRCGDDIVDEDHEECDLGELNGRDDSDTNGVPCTEACVWRGRIIFVSSQVYTGDLGGLAGADEKCNDLAEAAGVGKKSVFRAWLSDGLHGPADRFEQTELAGRPYFLLDHVTIIAQDFDELTLLGPRAGISVDENRDHISDAAVWTNTDVDGSVFSKDYHCDGWTSTSDTDAALRGRNDDSTNPALWKAAGHWTRRQTLGCNIFAHLYCLEDGVEETDTG